MTEPTPTTIDDVKDLILPVVTEAEIAAFAAEEIAVKSGNKTLGEVLPAMAGLIARAAHCNGPSSSNGSGNTSDTNACAQHHTNTIAYDILGRNC